MQYASCTAKHPSQLYNSNGALDADELWQLWQMHEGLKFELGPPARELAHPPLLESEMIARHRPSGRQFIWISLLLPSVTVRQCFGNPPPSSYLAKYAPDSAVNDEWSIDQVLIRPVGRQCTCGRRQTDLCRIVMDFPEPDTIRIRFLVGWIDLRSLDRAVIKTGHCSMQPLHLGFSWRTHGRGESGPRQLVTPAQRSTYLLRCFNFNGRGLAWDSDWDSRSYLPEGPEGVRISRLPALQGTPYALAEPHSTSQEIPRGNKNIPLS